MMCALLQAQQPTALLCADVTPAALLLHTAHEELRVNIFAQHH